MTIITSIIVTIISILISVFLGFYINRIIKIRNRYNNVLYNIKEKPTFDEVIIKQTQRSIQHIIDEYNLLRRNNNNKFIKDLIEIRNFYYEKKGIIEKKEKRHSFIDKENETLKSKNYITIYDVILSDIHMKNIKIYYIIMIPSVILISYYIPKIIFYLCF